MTGYLGEADRRTVTALFEAILPGAPDAPGATDADAVSYLDNLLGSDAYREIPRWRETYRVALPALRRAGADTEAEKVLHALADGALPDWPDGLDQRRVFALLREHCIEGCFADPRWGGNAGGLMWRWFGYAQPAEPFPGAPVRRP